MGIPQPTGDYADEMLDAGGWPDVDEDTYYDRALEYTRVLRQVTDVLQTCQSQHGEIFDGGVWAGGAAGAANVELGTNIDGLETVQNGLVTVITWQRYIAGSIAQAKSDISDNVYGAHRQINVLENDSSLDSDQRTAAIDTVVKATNKANVSLVTGTADQIRASKAWKPPPAALKELLDQKIPPPVTIPDSPLPVPTPSDGTVPRPTPVQPVIPTPVIPTPVNPTPVNPVRPVQPDPVVPVPDVVPQPVIPVTPAVEPVTPAPVPGGGSGPVVPSVPGGVPGGVPVSPLRPAAATQQADGAGKGVTPASSPASAPVMPMGVSEESGPAVAPAAAGGMPAAPMAPGAGGGASGGSSGGSGAPVGQKAPGGKAPSTRPAASSGGKQAARSGPGSRQKSADHAELVDATPAAAIIPVSPTLAARDAMADAATADAARRKSGGTDPLRLGRRIAAALNAPGSGGEGDFGFFWVTGVTTDGDIVVANSYGLAYIPEGVQLPDKVHMASAEQAISANERARWATYPVMALQGWAAHRNTKLRAVIATEEQLANSDPGVTKVVLKPEDIPDSGEMTGRSRLEVVDPAAAERLSETPDTRLVALMPPAPATATPSADPLPEPEAMDPDKAAKLAADLTAGALDLQDLLEMMPAKGADAGAKPPDQRPMLWFEVMKPMTSAAAGRQAAHLRAFHTYAAASEEAVLAEAHTAVDPIAQRSAVAEWLYWKHVAGLLNAALADAS